MTPAKDNTDRTALDAQLDRLRRWEDPEVVSAAGPVYREMCGEATERAAGVAKAAVAKRKADQS
jgi:hypothetical protein